MDERRFDVKRDGLGILLIALGLFPAALIVYALVQTSSDPGPIARAWIRMAGAVPSLVFTGGILFLGTRLFLFDRRDGLARHAAGFAGLALALAILLGAFSTTAGGGIGDAIGGLVSATVHPAAGGLFGLIALALAVWFPWLRGRMPARALAIPDAPEPDEDPGVSAEEAAALIPDEEFNHTLDAGRKSLAAKPVRSAPPPSPYPEDVRLKGQIPVGARPLTSTTDARPEPESAAQPSSVYRWTAGRADVPVDGADEDLARTPDVVFDAEPVVESAAIREHEVEFGDPRVDGGEPTLDGGQSRLDNREPQLEIREPQLDDGEIDDREHARDVAQHEDLRRPSRGSALATEEAESELIAAHDRVAAPDTIALQRESALEPSIALPRPSWEQSNLFTEPSDDLPVDAYGTPLTLVEALRRARGADAIGADAAENVPAETEFAAELEAGVEHGTEIVESRDALEVDDDGEIDVEDDAEEDLEFEAIDDAGLDEDEEDDFEEDDLEDAADAEPDSHEAAFQQREDAIEPRDDDLASHEIESHEESLGGEIEEAAPVEALADDDLEPAADVAEEASPRVQPLAAVASEGPLVELMEKRAARDPSARRSEPPATTHAASVEREERTEREVILAPHAAPLEKTIKSLPVQPERVELLREAGCLFVERGRVAVSMLQRQYGMDFDQACEVLDELQTLGLIGPYLGGQRRDILLTREQWLEKVGSV